MSSGLAGKRPLCEARRVEVVLTRSSIAHVVALETYLMPVYPLFALGVYVGASFFVASEQALQARKIFWSLSLKVGIDDTAETERDRDGEGE